MDNQFLNLINQSKSILILIPSKPSLDEVAAGLSLYLSVKQSKDVIVASFDQMTVEFNRLIGVNRISQELGNKNLIISFSDYKASDIERVSYDIEDGQFKLTVIPKPGITAPQKDQVMMNYSGVSSDLVIMIGGENENSYPVINSKDLLGATFIYIGTHEINWTRERNVVSIVGVASSVSEIVAGLIRQSGMFTDGDIATNLLMGIEDASKNFSGEGVTAQTFGIFSELLSLGGKRLNDQGMVNKQYPVGSIPGQNLQQVVSSVQNQTPQMPTTQNPVVPADTDKFQDEEIENPPNDWLKPKIFKGSSIS